MISFVDIFILYSSLMVINLLIMIIWVAISDDNCNRAYSDYSFLSIPLFLDEVFNLDTPILILIMFFTGPINHLLAPFIHMYFKRKEFYKTLLEELQR